MKKTYFAPALETVYVQTQNMMALSIGGKADDSDVLVKGANDWDNIWGGNDDDFAGEE